MEDATLTWPDIVVIVGYFLVVLGTGLWASCRATTSNVPGYFLAGKTTGWIPIGASTFATNIGAHMFVGLAGSAAATGIAVTMYEWHAMWMLLLLGWIFLPVYLACGCYTMPEYLKLRYGGSRIRVWLAVIDTFHTIISSLAGQMYAGALFIQQILKWDIYLSVLLLLAMTAVFTVMGGLKAVLWTDTLQTAIIAIGAFTVSGISLYKMGGFEAMREQFMAAAANYTYLDQALYGNHSCGFPPEDSFHIFRSADDSGYPWPGMIVGLTILALSAWCTDQNCVQRSLSAKNLSHAKAGVMLAAYLKILPFVFFIIPGMLSRVLYPDEVACADPDKCREVCDNPSGCYDLAYPLLVLRNLPQGVRGIMMAALLSALVSSLTSIFNSASTIMTIDLWQRCRPKASERELMVVGRVCILILVVVSILWLPALQVLKGSEFWAYSQAIHSFFVPPIVMVFLFGIFWKRTTEQGAFWGLIVAFVVGVIRMGLQWSRPSVPCGSTEESNPFVIVSRVHFLHFAIILSVVTSIVIVVVSIVTAPRPEAKLRRVTWWTRNSVELQELSDESDDDDDDDDFDDQTKKTESDEFSPPGGQSRLKYLSLKWCCGVDLKERKQRMTKEERRELQMTATNIKQDPFWKKVIDANGLLCCACCCFLHAFWF